MNEKPGSPSVETVLREFAVLLPILVVAGVLLLLLGQTASLSPGEFTVVDLERNETTVDENETVDVSATIRNTGDITETQYVRFTLGQAEKERSVTLEPGESETIRLRGVAAGSLGIGETTYRIRTDADVQSATLTVDSQRPPKFAVSDLKPTAATLAADETRTTISANVEKVGGKTLRSETVALESGASTRIAFEDIDPNRLGVGVHR